ncbi:MAG: hypothetical protein LLG09_01470 [Negativicutes bacterium]|nr:hypothetical protein [Negativicutes bacterium]
MMKTPPGSFRVKQLLLSPVSLLISAVTIGLAFFGVPQSVWFFDMLIPVSGLVLATGSLLELIYLVRTAASQKFKDKLQKDWSLKSLSAYREKLRAASKDYEKQRSRANYQRVRFERVRKLERDMFDDFTRMEVWDNDVAQEVLAQSLKGFLRYYELLNRDQRIASLLENSNLQQIQDEIDRMQRQAVNASSAEAVNQYQRAVKFKQQELKSLERIRQSSILLQAHLDTLESALSSLRTRLVNSTVWGNDSVRFELSNLTQELMALENAMEELEGVDSAAQEIERELV